MHPQISYCRSLVGWWPQMLSFWILHHFPLEPYFPQASLGQWLGTERGYAGPSLPLIGYFGLRTSHWASQDVAGTALHSGTLPVHLPSCLLSFPELRPASWPTGSSHPSLAPFPVPFTGISSSKWPTCITLPWFLSLGSPELTQRWSSPSPWVSGHLLWVWATFWPSSSPAAILVGSPNLTFLLHGVDTSQRPFCFPDFLPPPTPLHRFLCPRPWVKVYARSSEDYMLPYLLTWNACSGTQLLSDSTCWGTLSEHSNHSFLADSNLPWSHSVPHKLSTLSRYSVIPYNSPIRYGALVSSSYHIRKYRSFK